MDFKRFIRKNWSNLLIIAIIALLLIPQTGLPIKVFFNRLIAFSPSEISEKKRDTLNNYNWELESLDGIAKNLSSSEGNVILINFWATWCPPCVAEMPSLQELYNDYGEKVDFYFVSLEDPIKVSKFMEKNQYSFPVFIAKQQVPDAIESYSLPTTYVISKDGKIAMDKSGAADWNSESVHRLLDKLLQD